MKKQTKSKFVPTATIMLLAAVAGLMLPSNAHAASIEQLLATAVSYQNSQLPMKVDTALSLTSIRVDGLTMIREYSVERSSTTIDLIAFKESQMVASARYCSKPAFRLLFDKGVVHQEIFTYADGVAIGPFESSAEICAQIEGSARWASDTKISFEQQPVQVATVTPAPPANDIDQPTATHKVPPNVPPQPEITLTAMLESRLQSEVQKLRHRLPIELEPGVEMIDAIVDGLNLVRTIEVTRSGSAQIANRVYARTTDQRCADPVARQQLEQGGQAIAVLVDDLGQRLQQVIVEIDDCIDE